MKRLTVLLTIVMACTTTYGYLVTDYEWYSYNGHQYALTMEHSNWADAEAEAIAVGGHLVTINDPAEHQWLLDESNPLCSSYAIGHPGEPWQNGSWIGFYYSGVGDLHSLDSWTWLTGEVGSDFLVPANSFYGYDGIHMVITGTYHPEYGMISNGPHVDLNPDYYLQGIIEVVPEPCTLSLLALGGLFLRKRKKL